MFGESAYFAFIQVRLADRHIESRKILENPFTGIERGKGIRVAEWLINEKVDRLIIREDIKHKGPGYVLSNAGVTVNITPADSLEEAMQSFEPSVS